MIVTQQEIKQIFWVKFPAGLLTHKAFILFNRKHVAIYALQPLNYTPY